MGIGWLPKIGKQSLGQEDGEDNAEDHVPKWFSLGQGVELGFQGFGRTGDKERSLGTTRKSRNWPRRQVRGFFRGIYGQGTGRGLIKAGGNQRYLVWPRPQSGRGLRRGRM